MKEKKDWVDQAKVDQAGDAIVAKNSCSPADVNGYAIAKHLDCKPNGSIYEKTYDWKKRRVRAENSTALSTDSEFHIALQALLHRSVEEQAKLVSETLAKHIDHANRVVQMSVAKQDTTASMMDADFAELAKLADQLQVELDAARAAGQQAKDELQQAQAQSFRDQGTIEALERQLARRTMIIDEPAEFAVSPPAKSEEPNTSADIAPAYTPTLPPASSPTIEPKTVGGSSAANSSEAAVSHEMGGDATQNADAQKHQPIAAVPDQTVRTSSPSPISELGA